MLGAPGSGQPVVRAGVERMWLAGCNCKQL